jgi:hypothetical protein
MLTDVKRIGLGNSKFPAIDEVVIPVTIPDFEFSSIEITFDQGDRSFDEE